MNPVFTYNQNLATQIGGGLQYVSGGYDLKIVRAQMKEGKFLEFDFEEKEGRKFQFISINHTKNDNTPNEFGHKMINAIMGCVGVSQLTCDQQGNVPELSGKYLKGILQRVNYTKQSGENAGKDGFRFEFKMPASIKDGRTVKEMVEQKPAEAFDRYAESVEDKDERGSIPSQPAQQAPQSAQPQYSDVPMDFDDDIPFAPVGLQYRNLLNAI